MLMRYLKENHYQQVLHKSYQKVTLSVMGFTDSFFDIR
jgi:hypothetical protein